MITEETAAFLLGSLCEQFSTMRYLGRATEEFPPHSRSFKHVDTYEVVRRGDTTLVDVPEGDGYHATVSEGTEFDIVITDHGFRAGRKHQYTVQLVMRVARIQRDDRTVVATAEFTPADHSPVTVHRTAFQLVANRFPRRATEAHGVV